MSVFDKTKTTMYNCQIRRKMNNTMKRPMVYENTDHLLTSPFITYLKDRTALDLAFQSESRWDLAQRIKFIVSLITGMAPSKIVICDIKECMSKCDVESYDYMYFKHWHDQGYETISIDGNNRTITISEYLSSNIPLPEGDYILPDGKVIKLTKINNVWSKHPPEFKKYIENNVFVTVARYTNAKRHDLTDLFLNINDGMTLNQQEKRNAILVPYAEWVRNMVSKTYNDMIKTVLNTEKQKVRRVIDELIVEMSIYTAFGTSVTIQAAEKNKAYEDDSTVSQQTKRSEKIILSFNDFIKRNKDSKLKDKSTLFNLFMLFVHIYENDYAIRDEKSFYNWFFEKENKRIGNDKPIMTTKTGESRSYNSCNQTMSSPELTARFEKIIEDFNETIDDIVFLKDANRLYTKQERYTLWKNQNGVCPETGKTIPESEINDDTKWHADHIIPYSKGGKTTIENGRLICKTANLKKSNKLKIVA